MIKINGELCYSPQPPQSYIENGRRSGFGRLITSDVQLWNLVFLTMEEFDASTTTEERISAEFKAYYQALAALTCHESMTACPNLRSALTKHPTVFAQELWKMDWEILPQVLENPEWPALVIDKIAHIEAVAKKELAAMINSRDGNIVSVNFGGK